MPEPAMWTAGSAVVAVTITGLFTWRNSRAATGPQNSQANLEWAKQAHLEATEAKTEARQAKADAAAAETKCRDTERRMDEQDRRLRELDAVAHELIGWINRVVVRAQRVDGGGPHDPAVTDLLRVINGGPPSMSNSQIHDQRP